MAPRRRDSLYAGALGCITADRIATLGTDYVLQPKHDGIYATITTDSTGRIANILMRSGTSVPHSIARDFSGVSWAPDCVLAAELEAMTEASDRLSRSRGYRIAPILDALRVTGRDVSSLPQSDRRDALYRAWATLEDDRTWSDSYERTAKDRASGRFTRRIPNGHRRLPIVEQRPCSDYSSAMADWCDSGIAEGLVVVSRKAPIGRTGAKKKHKVEDHLDATVIAADRTAALLDWRGYRFTVSAINYALEPGQVVEVRHNGWEEREVRPKFARLVRTRPDLSSAPVQAHH